MQDVAVDFVSGNLAGWSFITMGMPLDFVKTKLQLRQDVSLLRLHELKKDQGFFKTFYRGVKFRLKKKMILRCQVKAAKLQALVP